MKRNLSTLPSPGPGTPPAKRRFFGVFSVLKQALLGPTADTRTQLMDDVSTALIQNEELENSFVSKKRRVSSVGGARGRKYSVPRSSLNELRPLDKYGSIYDSLSAGLGQQDDESSSGSPMPIENQLVKDVSPSIFIPKNQILPTDPREMELAEQDSLAAENEYGSVYKDNDGNIVRPPFINLDPRERYHLLQLKKSVEASEFLQSRLHYNPDADATITIHKQHAPAHRSIDDGEAAALKFDALRTKLALRNRKQRSKKKGFGMSSSDFLYDPVAPSQTKEKDALSLGILGTVTRPQFPKKDETPNGKHLADEDPRKKLSFKLESNSQKSGLDSALRNGTEPASLDEDFIVKTKALAEIINFKPELAQKKKNVTQPSSGFKFEIKSSDLNSAINLEGASKPKESTGKTLFGGVSQVSSAEKPAIPFGAPKPSTLDSKIANQSDTVSKNATPAFSFGALPDKPKTTSSFGLSKESSNIFGEKGSSATERDSDGKAEAPALFTSRKRTMDDDSETKLQLEGVEKTSQKSLPFSFSAKQQSTTPPAFSFGASKESKPSDEKPDKKSRALGTLFGQLTQAKTPDAVKLPFGSTETPANEKSGIPKVLFAQTSKEDENLEEKKTVNSAPKLAFGQSSNATSAPKFSFGSSVEKKDDSSTSKPLFGLTSKSVEAAEDKPKSSFGNLTDAKGEKEDKPLFSFGQGTKLPEVSTPQFSFGSKTSETNDPSTKKPAFSFGAAKPDVGEQKTLISFGGVKDSTPSTEANASDSAANKSEGLFKFGAQPEKRGNTSSGLFGKKLEDSQPVETTPAPSLPDSATINSPSTANSETAGESSAPKFSFGQTQKTTDSAPTLAFSFGTSSSGGFPAFGQTKAAAAPEKAEEKSTFTFSQPTPSAATAAAPAFSFSNPGTAQSNATSAPSFGFGQSATADPALIFGGGSTGGTSTPAPAFNFNIKPVEPQAQSTQNNAFSAGLKPANGFSFSNKAIAGISNSRPATPSNNGFNFSAGGQTNPAPFGGFGNASAPSSVFNGFSRSSTPGNGGFGQPQANAMPQMPQAPFGASNGFSFGNGGAANVFNSAPGSFGQASRENTPPAFGAMGGDANQLFTPPVANVSGRRIAQMRQRRR